MCVLKVFVRFVCYVFRDVVCVCVCACCFAS